MDLMSMSEVDMAFRAAQSPTLAPEQDASLIEVIAHLGAALTQALPSDDAIIMGHIRTAHAIAVQMREPS
jgi:hypothetical protein